MSNTKKILVIGASIAGPAVCYWLKKFGFEATLIERNDGLRKGGYAIDIRGIAIDIAKKMNIFDALCERRTTIARGQYVDSEGKILHEEEGETFGIRQNDEVEFVRGDIVELLMNTIPEVPCHFNQKVASFEEQDGRIAVTLQDGKTEYYDLVIGADGLHSSTRRQVFTQDEYQLFDLGLYICIYNIPNFLKLDHTDVQFEKDQKSVHVSSDRDPNTAFAGFMFRSNQQLNDIRDVKEQQDFLRKNFSNLGWECNKLLELMDGCENFYFDSITQVKMNSWTKGRVALVGDAGYCASPMSGQGTSLALVGAYILAGELNAADGDHVVAFQRYNELLRGFVDANQKFGQWVSETYLTEEGVSEAVAEERTQVILQKMAEVTNAIELPQY